MSDNASLLTTDKVNRRGSPSFVHENHDMQRYKTNFNQSPMTVSQSPLTGSKTRVGGNVLSSSANNIVMPDVTKHSIATRSHSTLEYPTTHADTLTQSSLNIKTPGKYRSSMSNQDASNNVYIQNTGQNAYPNRTNTQLQHYEDSQSMRSSKSIILSAEQLAEKKRDILRRSNDRLKNLAQKSIEYDLSYMEQQQSSNL